MKRRILSIALLACAAVGSQAAPFQNGSFETGTNPPSNYTYLSTGSTDITGWVVGADGIAWIGKYWAAVAGNYSIELNIDTPGSISQTFDTVKGVTYDVGFDMSGNPDSDQGVKTMQVSAASSSQDYTFDTTGHTHTNMGWTPETFSFTATGSSSTLTFAQVDDIGDTPWGPTLDDVTVTAATPEPATFLPVALGVVGMLVRRRRGARRAG